MEDKHSKQHITELITSVEQLVEGVAKETDKVVEPYRRTAFSKFPLLFLLLTTFGLVATLYGFEKIIDNITLLKDHPLILLLVGLGVLALTGRIYKKLS